jgi:hypothetical protein
LAAFSRLLPRPAVRIRGHFLRRAHRLAERVMVTVLPGLRRNVHQLLGGFLGRALEKVNGDAAPCKIGAEALFVARQCFFQVALIAGPRQAAGPVIRTSKGG